MRLEVLKALIQNSTILVVAFLLVSRFSRWSMLEGRRRSFIIQGFAYALCGLLAIMFSVEVLPRVLIDMRTPIIIVAVLTGGPVVGLITIIPLLAYRIFLGGTGVYAGVGIIVTAYAFGMLLRAFEKKPGGYLFQLTAGIGSAVIYYIWILTLPGGIAMRVLNETFIPLTAGSVISIMVIFLIRKRETAHQDLMNRLGEINDLFEEISLDDNIGITVLDGFRIVHINQSLLTKFGYRGFDPENSDLLKLVTPENGERIRSFLQGVRNGVKTESVPMELTVPGRGTLNFLIHARTMIYRGMECFLVVSVDITRLVEAERALQSRVDQLQLALNASGAVLWKADLVRDAIQAGPDFFRLLRYAPDGDLPGFSDFLQASEVSAELMPQLDALRRGELQNVLGEICFAGSDGIRRWFNAGARITGAAEDGTPVEITGILYETTPIKEKELVRKEKELEDLQSQKMETIGRLAGGVAHDFNNLLHVIMGYTEILRKVSEDDPVTGELAKPILEASTRGRELVRQLLLFSRNKTPELAPVDLCSVTSSFLGLLRRIIEENIVIASRIPERLPRVMGDAGQIEQVLMNLCINSRDAMPDGGTISISLAERSFTRPEKMLSGNLRPGRYVVLEVSDTGPGIPPEKLRTVFEPFYTTKQVDKGTGLGLATVQGIIESHGGMISAANSPGGGFSIELYFPVAPAGAEVGHSTSRGSAGEKLDLDSISVLVAEDDPQVRNLTIEGLSAAGIRVYRASSGREAVEVFLSAPDSIDILIFDVVMPGLSGPDAFREIVNAGYRKPVIFTTGYAGDRLSCLPGDFVMISKPYAISELVQLIGEIIHQEGDGP